MSILKSFLNSLVSKLVTRNRVLKATKVEETEFDKWVFDIVDRKLSGWKEYNDLRMSGIDLFIRDFRKEGWCKEEYRDIFDTLFHLGREINSYAEYWF
jgi:hypothetical protein